MDKIDLPHTHRHTRNVTPASKSPPSPTQTTRSPSLTSGAAAPSAPTRGSAAEESYSLVASRYSLADGGSAAALPPLSTQVTDTRYFFLDLPKRPTATLAIVAGGRERCNPDYHINRHTFSHHTLEYVAEGHGTLTLNGHHHPLQPGTLFTYTPHTRCEIRTDPARPMLKYFIALQSSAAPRQLRIAGISTNHPTTIPAHAEIRNIIDSLILEGRRHTGLEKQLCTKIFEILLLKIRESLGTSTHPRHDTSYHSFHRCKTLIDTNAATLNSLEDIAAAANLEASTICRLFRRHLGTSPYQYLLRKKMNAAAALILLNNTLIKEAAQQVGFSDPFHFSRRFKQIHGTSPRTLLTRPHP